jgi:MFS family permease
VPSKDDARRPSPPRAAFRHRAFTVIWIATVVSNIGTWMYNAASGWLMVSLNGDALLVSLVQVATSLPMFLFALAAGALADIFDKRRFLIGVEAATTLLSALFAALVQFGAVTPGSLLLFMFLIGVGGALSAPGWQAVVPQLVPPQDLAPAVAANSVGINISRALGPALAGSIIGLAASPRRSGSTPSATSASSVHCCGGAHRSAPPIACPRSDSAARCAPAFAMLATTRICARR